MDRDKLAQLRLKKAENKAKLHKELLDSNSSIKQAVTALHAAINNQKPLNLDGLTAQLAELKDLQTYSEDIKRLEAALKESSNEKKLDDLINAVGNINNQDVVSAVNSLITKIEAKDISQSEEDYQPVRRVRKIGNRLVFDDDQLQVNVSNSGGGVQTTLIRNNNSLAVVNPDGSEIGGQDERFHFTLDGKLETTASITGDVIVDNVGIENVAGDKINPATEETLQSIDTTLQAGITAQVDLTQLDRTNYAFYDKAEDTNYKYIAKQSAQGNWYIMRIPKTGVNDITKYAVGSSDLATAWASFASQSYADWDTNNSPTSSGVLSMAGMATEDKQDTQITELQGLNSKDYSTETTLAEISTKLDVLLAKPIEIIDSVHEHIHDGKAFTVFDLITLTSGASYTIVVNTNDTIRKHSYLQAYSAEELEVVSYEGVTTTSDGTPIAILNRNRNSVGTSTAQAYHTPTGLITTSAVKVRHARVGSKNAFGETQQTNELVLKANTKYSVTFTNRGNNTAYLNWQWFWYECEECA